MINKFRILLKEKLAVKIITVLLVVFMSIAIMLPVIELAEWFGVNIRENTNLNFKVDFPSVFFFFLFGSCSVAIIWLAQKYLHQEELLDLGFRSKFSKLFIFGFFVGVLRQGLYYVVLLLNAGNVKYISVIPDDISILTYAGYYIYFFFGFIFWNSLIEELGTRAYPIESLKRHLNPHIIFVLMGILFTGGHFVLQDFSIGYCLSLFITSYNYSLLYYYSNSIWLVIGMHSGINWLGFSLSSTNWKLGALVKIEMSNVPEWIASFTSPMLGLLLLLLVVYSHKKGFFRKFCS